MKKVMIALAAVALAGAAQAAGSWTVKNAGAYDGYKISLCTYDYVIVDATAFNAQSVQAFASLFLNGSSWMMTKSTTWKDHYATISGLSPESTIADGQAAGTFSNYDVVKTATFLVCKDGITPGGEYILMSTLHDDSGNNAFDFANATVLQSGHFNSDVVPEPTSGLLMLLGMAGLALRRKRG